MTLLDEHVKRFNAAVQSGDFGPMLENFADDATMAFEAYRERPPDDELDVLDVREDGDVVVAGYSWRSEPDARAGELRLTVADGRITRLVVTFEPPAPVHE